MPPPQTKSVSYSNNNHVYKPPVTVHNNHVAVVNRFNPNLVMCSKYTLMSNVDAFRGTLLALGDGVCILIMSMIVCM